VTRPLFAYGSLVVPDVLVALLARVPRSEPATLDGWSARCLHGEQFPGLVEQRGATASGLVLYEMTAEERALVDAWETDFYTKRVVAPTVGGGVVIDADAYVLDEPAAREHAEPRPWSVDVLVPGLASFCVQTRAFREAWLGRMGPD
jgi:hypothetical protein